jgi:cardiolipin synthase
LLTKQILADSGVELTHHPLRAARTLAADSVNLFEGAGHDLFAKRLALRLLGPPPELASCRPPLDPKAGQAAIESASIKAPRPASVQLYSDGAEALAALERVIDSARCRLDVLMFTWGPDPVGRTIAARLAAKAGPDLRVRVLVDGGGNLLFGGQEGGPAETINETVCWLAHQPYVEVLRTRDPFGHFDHRKLVLADGRLAWTGGRNFTQLSFFPRRDLSFTLTGPLTAELQDSFERFWRDQGGEPAGPLPPDPAFDANASACLVETTPSGHNLDQALYRAVDRARHHVYVENPYLSDSRLLWKLARARRRGVEVCVILTIASRSPGVNRANRVTANRLLAAGVRVFLYPGPQHTKAASVDGSWAYVGTGNFDPLSLRRNRELGLVISAGPLAGQLEETQFLPALQPEWELREPLPLSMLDYASELVVSLF